MDETTQATEQTQPEPNDASRDELIAAVRTAAETEGGETLTEGVRVSPPAGTAPASGAPGTEPTDPEEPRIAAILRAREKANAEREAARNHAQELIEQARQESERLIREARERADREWQAELERRRTEFRASPTAQLRQMGDPQDIVDQVLREGTPEARKMREMEERLAEASKKAEVADDVRKQFEDFKTQQAQEKHQQMVEQVRSKFLGEHASSEKAPYLNARYEPDEIFAKADALALKWKQGGMKLGSDFDYDDVTQYLEREAKQKLSALNLSPARQVSAGAPEKGPGNAPKVPANGPRTLSAAQGSERRTTPKPVGEMTREEERQALIEAAQEVRRTLPAKT